MSSISTVLRKLPVAVAGTVACLALAGCGGGGNGSEAPVASASPRCSDVWKAGETISEDYDGCLDDTQHLVAAVKDNCKDGSELTTYDDRYWAVLGGEVQDTGSAGGTDTDQGYADAQASCAA